MADHPVRMTVTDDLRRSRLTVFFRLLLAIPHFVWFALWSVAAYFASLVNWVATLIAGRSPASLHRFLSAYLRYATHFGSYLFLAANPYPGFTGEPGYPVDLEVDEPARQNRWIVGFRLPLAVPALLLGVAFIGFGGGWGTEDKAFTASITGTLGIVACFGWFASLARAQMPPGFRDLQAYGLRYVAQLAAYALVLTDRYPNVDPAQPLTEGPEHPVRLLVEDDLRRSRLTVFFRLLLAIPHFVWVVLWTVAAVLTAIVTWFATLIIGRPPKPLHRFLSAYIRYTYHLYAYATLAANPFPGFTGTPGSYPIDVELPPAAPQRRLVTAFRILLAVPAIAVSGGLDTLIFISAFLGWFAALATGRMPRSLREAQAYALRYGAQVSAYLFLVTDRYPYSGPRVEMPALPPAETPAVA